MKPEAQLWLQPTMLDTKKSMELRLPFAMEPVVYEFEINDRGTWGTFASDQSQRMSNDYYAMMVPAWLQLSPHEILKSVRFEMEQLGSDYRNLGHFDAFKRIIEGIRAGGKATREKVETMLKC